MLKIHHHSLCSYLLLLLLMFLTKSVDPVVGSPADGKNIKYDDAEPTTNRQLPSISSHQEYNYRGSIGTAPGYLFRSKHDLIMPKRKQAKKQKSSKKGGPIRDWVPSISWPTASPRTSQPSTNMPSLSPTNNKEASTLGPTIGAVGETMMPTESPSAHPTDGASPAVIIITGAPITSFPSSAPSFSKQPSPAPMSVTSSPSSSPSMNFSMQPTSESPSNGPTSNISSDMPSEEPSGIPSTEPSTMPPSISPTMYPSNKPSRTSKEPSTTPTLPPSRIPTANPSNEPSGIPSDSPSITPSDGPSLTLSSMPTASPSSVPSDISSDAPSDMPSGGPSLAPSSLPTGNLSMEPTTGPTNIHATFNTSHLEYHPLHGFELALTPKNPLTRTNGDKDAPILVAAMNYFLFSELRSTWTTIKSISLQNGIPMASGDGDIWMLVISSGYANFSKNTTMIPTAAQVQQAQRDVLKNNETIGLVQDLFDEWELDWIIINVTLSAAIQPSNKTAAVSESSTFSAADTSSNESTEVSAVLLPTAVGIMLVVSVAFWATKRKRTGQRPLGSFPQACEPQDPATIIMIHSLPSASTNSIIDPESSTAASFHGTNTTEEEDSGVIEISFVYNKDQQEGPLQTTVLFDEKLDDFIWEVSSSSSCNPSDEEESTRMGKARVEIEGETLSVPSFRTALEDEVMEEGDIMSHTLDRKDMDSVPSPQPPVDQTTPSMMSHFLTWDSLVQASFFVSNASPEKDCIFSKQHE